MEEVTVAGLSEEVQQEEEERRRMGWRGLGEWAGRGGGVRMAGARTGVLCVEVGRGVGGEGRGEGGSEAVRCLRALRGGGP